jgi:hypothetical protein
MLMLKERASPARDVALRAQIGRNLQARLFTTAEQAIPEHRCGGSGGPITTLGTLKDDLTHPSRNIEIWNRSACASLLYDAESPVCTDCWMAYSSVQKRWSRSLANKNAFKIQLAESVAAFPVPDRTLLRSKVVYTQSFDGVSMLEEIRYWAKRDEHYLSLAKEYAARNALRVSVENGTGDLADQVSVHAQTGESRKQPN